MNDETYKGFLEYMKQHFGASAGVMDASERLADEITLRELTILPPIVTSHPSTMIHSLYGDTTLSVALDTAKTSADPSLELILYKSLLPHTPISIDNLSIANKWNYIIPASAITDQYVNNERKIITIPIEAFNNKSTLAYKRQDDSTGQGMLYHYIFLQSAKDPKLAQPIALFRGMRTNKLCSMLMNEKLKSQGWQIEIQQGEALLQYMDHYTKGWPDIPALPSASLNIMVPTHTVVRREATTPYIDIQSQHSMPWNDPAIHKILFGDNAGSTPTIQ